MNIVSSKIEVNTKTFEPLMVVTVEIPIELVTETGALLGELETAQLIGTEFISAWKRHKQLA